jgi:hypothetical protein
MAIETSLILFSDFKKSQNFLNHTIGNIDNIARLEIVVQM